MYIWSPTQHVLIGYLSYGNLFTYKLHFSCFSFKCPFSVFHKWWQGSTFCYPRCQICIGYTAGSVPGRIMTQYGDWWWSIVRDKRWMICFSRRENWFHLITSKRLWAESPIVAEIWKTPVSSRFLSALKCMTHTRQFCNDQIYGIAIRLWNTGHIYFHGGFFWADRTRLVLNFTTKPGFNSVSLDNSCGTIKIYPVRIIYSN